MKKWLNDNKIYFETMVMLILSITGIIISYMGVSVSKTANKSSTTRIPKTTPANLWLRSPISSKALNIMVVDDIDSMPPRNIELIWLQPSIVPVRYPSVIIPVRIVMAPIIAVPPTFSSFFILNSKPRANKRNITPISAHILMLSILVTVGIISIDGPARIPATIYPRTTGCFSHLNRMVTIPARIRITARSEISEGMCDIFIC